MQCKVIQRRRSQLTAIFAGAAAGGGAVLVSQWHVLPPMQCFALLVAGLAVLGATAYVAAKWYLPIARGARTAKHAPATLDADAARVRVPATHARP